MHALGRFFRRNAEEISVDPILRVYGCVLALAHDIERDGPGAALREPLDDLGRASPGPGPPAYQLEARLVDDDDANVRRRREGPAEAGVPVQNAQLDLFDESGRGEEAEESERDRQADQSRAHEAPERAPRTRLGFSGGRSLLFRGAILACVGVRL
jgi:hypothetical protein